MEQRLVVMDGQGGGVGRALIERLRAGGYEGFLLAVGTNAAATAAMVKAGASAGATGEYAVVYNAARADVLAGPIGIVLAGGMMGEFSPAMARAVAESPAQKVLVPVSRCGVQVAGLEAKPLGGYIADAAELILTQCRSSALWTQNKTHPPQEARSRKRGASCGGCVCCGENVRLSPPWSPSKREWGRFCHPGPWPRSGCKRSCGCGPAACRFRR